MSKCRPLPRFGERRRSIALCRAVSDLNHYPQSSISSQPYVKGNLPIAPIKGTVSDKRSQFAPNFSVQIFESLRAKRTMIFCEKQKYVVTVRASLSTSTYDGRGCCQGTIDRETL